MQPSRPPPSTVKAAADAVVEFALISLEPEFLLWVKTVNLRVAELIWNAHSCGGPAPFADPPEPALTRLIDRLSRARATRWGEERFLVFGLDVDSDDVDITFTFDLTWDEGHSFHPCEIAVDFPLAGPSTLN